MTNDVLGKIEASALGTVIIEDEGVLGSGAGSGDFINHGLVRSASAGKVIITLPKIQNHGRLLADAGTMEIEGSTLDPGGTLFAKEGSVIALTNVTFKNGEVLHDPGFIAAGRIDVFGQTTFDGETEVKVGATVVVNDASSLRLSNTVALDFANISLKPTTGAAALIIDGTISGTGHIKMMQGTAPGSESIIRGFTSVTPLKIEELISINGVGKLGANHLGDVTNHGIVENDTGGTLEIDLSPGHKFVNASSGKVEVVIGEMRVATDTPFVNASGELFVFQGATFESEGLFRQTAGSTIVRGSMTAPFFVFEGGDVGGSGTINGESANSAKFKPGDSPGTLTINGNYSQLETGILEIELAGNAHDRFIVNGIATLGGRLEVIFLPDLTAPAGSTFDVLIAEQIVDSFDDLIVPLDALGNPTLDLEIISSGAMAQVRVTALTDLVPEPSTAMLMTLCVFGARLRVNQSTGRSSESQCHVIC